MNSEQLFDSTTVLQYNMPLNIYTVMPTAEHTNTIIFLHGRDSTAEEFASELFESQSSDGRFFGEMLPHFKWVFPSSKLRNSKRFGNEMSQWFDMWSVEAPEEQLDLQTPGLSESAESILEIINKEALEVPMDQIILAGISQGCATAIYTLLCGNIQLGGFVGFCGWIPYGVEFSNRIVVSEGALETPVFLAHSVDDTVVPVANGEALREELDRLKMVVEWHCYEDGGHWVNEPKGMDDFVAFITKLDKNPVDCASTPSKKD